MKPRVTAAQRRELLNLRTPGNHQRQGGVMVVPGIWSIEDWEREATASQERLIAEARDDPRYQPEPVPEPMSASEERAFAQRAEAIRRQQGIYR